jgi:SAM-dependent methyltransferase
MLEDTGERMVPERTWAPVFWDHIYRYRFAASFVRGLSVVDIACGAGYGTAALAAAGASSVVGFDISSEAVEHARGKYGIDARVGRCEAIPLPSKSIDVVVSFETIEHVAVPGEFITECARVLKPDGLLIISSPNRAVFPGGYSDDPFHVSEMNMEEFSAVVATRFPALQLFSQRPVYAPWWSFRSITAPEAAWFRLPGPNRVRRLIQSLVCPHLANPLDEQRALAARTVLGRDRLFASLFNPSAVRRYVQGRGEKPVYFLAVARQP